MPFLDNAIQFLGYDALGCCESLLVGMGVATRRGRRQKPRFLPPGAKLMSEKSAAGH
jgi:hypothetical protein